MNATANRRARWVKHLSDQLLPQDLTMADRISILCTMVGREMALLPEDRAAEERLLALMVTQAAESDRRDVLLRDTALRTAPVAGSA